MAKKVEGIDGLQELQDYNLRVIAGIRGPYLVEGVRDATAAAHRYAVSVTHVVTGALRASHRIEVVSARAEGFISLDKAGRNPRSGALTSEYGIREHDRGGDHAFYERTYLHYGDQAGEIGLDSIMKSVRNGKQS